jgi:AsmA-like C-terminal region/Protein of unknown function
VILATGAILAAGAAWRLHRGPIALPFLAPRIERSISELLPDVVADVAGAELAWSARGPAIRVLDVELRRRDGTPLASFPRLSIRPSLRALLRADFAIARIDVAGARLALVRSRDGQIGAGSSSTAVLASLVGGSDRASPGYLSHIALTDAQLALDDRARGSTWLAEGSQVDIRLHPAEIVVRVQTRLTLQSEASRILRDFELSFSATASVRRDAAGRLVGGTIDARGDEGRIRLANGAQTPLPLRSLRLQGNFSGTAETVDVTALEATAGPVHLKSTAHWSTGSDALEIRGVIGSLRADELPRLWPAGLATGAREWVARNLRDGTVTAVDFVLQFPGRAPDGAAVPANEVEVQFGFTGLTIHYLRPLHPLRAAHGSAKLTATRFEADVDGGSDGALSVHRGHMGVDLREPGVPARVDFDVSGPTAEVLALLDQPPLGIPSRFGLPIERASGSGDGHVEIRFPLSKSTASGLKVITSAELRETSLPALVYGVGIENGHFQVHFDGHRFEIEGDTGLSGVRWVTEPLHVALSYEPGESASLLHATFAGRDLSGEVEGALDGKTLRTLSVARLRYGRSDLSGRLARDRTGCLRVSVSGETLDLEPFITRFDSKAAFEPSTGDPWDLDARARRVLVGADLELAEVSVHAQGEGKDVRRAAAAGRLLGSGNFRLDLEARDGGRHLTLSSGRAGELLSALHLYDHAEGGRLGVDAAFAAPGAGGDVAGEVEMSDFRITQAPILTRVLSLGSLDGIARMLSGEGIAFSLARVPFLWSDGRLEVRHATAVGAIGLTADGTIDRKNDRIDVRGSLIPAYTLNSALGKLPLFGKFLVGGEGGGVFGIEYRVGGRPQEPEVKVNALSALAPVVLRQMFVDPFTRKPSAPTEPPPTGR